MRAGGFSHAGRPQGWAGQRASPAASARSPTHGCATPPTKSDEVRCCPRCLRPAPAPRTVDQRIGFHGFVEDAVTAQGFALAAYVGVGRAGRPRAAWQGPGVSVQAQPAARRSHEDELRLLRAQVQRLQADLLAERAERARTQQDARGKDEFLAMVAHELRAPLAAILGWTHLLRDRPGEGDFESGLAVIEQSAQVQLKLIEDLLVLARATGEGISMDFEPLDLRRVLDAAVDAVVPAAAEKELRMARRYDAAAGLVRGDPTRLQQVLGNIVGNAVKFTPKHGRIDVSLARSRGWAVVAVSDTGPGIPPQFLPHVFDRFRQDPDAARAHGGLGLGMAIARQLVELHGGAIEVHSEGEGCGATFVVRLPLDDER